MVAIGAVVASGAQEVIGTLVAIGAVGVLGAALAIGGHCEHLQSNEINIK